MITGRVLISLVHGRHIGRSLLYSKPRPSNKMSLADELLADLEEVGEDDDQQHEGDEIMDAAAEQLEDLAKMADKSVRAVAKLGESREVSDVMVLLSVTRLSTVH